MSEVDLFSFKPPASYPMQETSHEARRSMKNEIPPMDARLIGHLTRKPMTCWEIENESGLSHQSASAGLRRLAQKGQIEDSGDRRNTQSGRKAIVWRLTTEEKEG